MNCRDAQQMIRAYFDNRLDPLNDRLIAEHVKSCEKCRSELEFFGRYRDLLNTVKPASPPDDFLAELHRRIDLETDENPLNRIIVKIRYLRNSIQFPIEAAGVLAAAVVILFLYRPFISERIQKYTGETAIEIPAARTPEEKVIPEDSALKPRSAVLKEIPSQKEKGRSGKQSIPESKTVEDDQSVKTDTDSASGDAYRQLPSAELEKSADKEEDRSLSVGSQDTKEVRRSKKDSVSGQGPAAEKILWESDVSILRKDLSRSDRLFYKIKVDPAKYRSLINRLKQDYLVEETIVKRNNGYYQVELFLEKKK